MSVLLRLVSLMSIGVITTWPVTTFINNAKIILLLSEQKALTAYFLQPRFFEILLVFIGNSISINWIARAWFALRKMNSKLSYAKALAIQRSL